MVTDTETVLRDKLKVALQDAKNLFDDGLLDDKEFKDLKAHELSKYKEHLAAVTASSISRAIDTPPSDSIPTKTPEETTPVHTPQNTRQNRHLSRTSPPNSVPSSSSPPTVQRRRAPNDLVYVDANTFKRLTTPPIFRRRSAKKRKIVVPSADLQALQGFGIDSSLHSSKPSPAPPNPNLASSES